MRSIAPPTIARPKPAASDAPSGARVAALALGRRWWPAVMVIGLTALALIARWWDLGAHDSQVYHDEMGVIHDAIRFITGERTDPFANDVLYNPALFEFLLSWVFRVTGVSVTAAREYAAVWGALGIPLLYGLARELGLRRSAAAAAALLLATSSWHVHLSRMALININGATVVELTLYCAVAAIRRRSLFWAGLTGVSLALAANGYIGSRVIVPALGLWLLYLAVFHRARGRGAAIAGGAGAAPARAALSSPLFRVPAGGLLAGSAVALAVAVALAYPLIHYYLADPAIFSAYTMHSTAFSAEQAQNFAVAHPELRHDAWGIAQYQFAHTIGMLTIPGQGPLDAWENLPGRPLLDPLSNAFLLVGLLVCLRDWRRPVAALLLCWVLLTYALGVFLTIDPPAGHRVIVMAPALYLIIVLGIEAALSALFGAWPRLIAARRASRSAGPRGRHPVHLSRGLLFAIVVVIGVVNIRRVVEHESSPAYAQSVTNSGVFYGRFLARFGAAPVDIVTPLGWADDYSLIAAPRAVKCLSQWTNVWQRCSPARVVIFDVTSDAEAARYAGLVHRPARPGPAPLGQTLFWSVTSPDAMPLPDPAVVLGHAGAHS